MKQQEKRDWFYIISPCIIALTLSIIGIIICYSDLEHSKGWSMLGVMICSYFLLVVVIVDFVLKQIIKKKTGLLWLIEIALIVVTALIFRNYFGIG